MTFSDATVREAERLVRRYPVARSALLPLLHLVQSVEGYVSAEGIALCARLLSLTKAEVEAVSTFYTMYKREPFGDYLLSVCTNPTCKILDIEDLARRAHAVGALVVVDNTFATPINQNPLALGADLVVHSATKFLGGHADALGGVLCGPKDAVDAVFHFREINGATLHPEAAYLLLRGMKTLQLRIERQNANAIKVARFLDEHPFIAHVFYPGLESHANHDVAKRQMRGFGGMMSFQLAIDDFGAVKDLLPRLEYAHRAANLGAVETIVAPPRSSSHLELTKEERAQAGIPETLVRYSTGIEDAGDLIDDLRQALDATMQRFGVKEAAL